MDREKEKIRKFNQIIRLINKAVDELPDQAKIVVIGCKNVKEMNEKIKLLFWKLPKEERPIYAEKIKISSEIIQKSNILTAEFDFEYGVEERRKLERILIGESDYKNSFH